MGVQQKAPFFIFSLNQSIGLKMHNDKYEETLPQARPFIFVVLLPLILVFGFGLFQDLDEARAQGISPFLKVFLSAQTGGLGQPTHITNAGDGSGRLFVVEQPGRIRIVKNGVLLATPFLDISNTGANQVLFGGEQGLLSVAFPLQFDAKGYFYVYYTNLNGDNVAARYFLSANPDVADPSSEVILRTFPHPTFQNHNGGQLAFGPDGFLYIGTGDGGSGGDPNNNGQNPNTFLGKILRIDVESVANPRIDTYIIPLNNPFVGTQGFLPEIWALGLRNPWRFSFDRLTGDLYFGDVGQDSFEEIDFQPASSQGGENYGWRIMEGLHCFNPPNCSPAGLTLPVIEYDHTQGNSVTGGMVYRGQNFPLMQGIYFYGDYFSGRIWGLKQNGAVWENALFLDTLPNIATFGEDEAGELYVADRANGRIYRLIGFSSQDIMNLITKYYQDILGRDPEPGGAEGWTAEIERIVSLDIDINEGFIAIGKSFFNSAEYLARGRTDAQYVADLYQSFLNRVPSQPEVNFWVAYLSGGANRNIVLNFFVFSPEFNTYMTGIFGVSVARPENNLVNDFYRGILSRTPDTVGFNYWLGLMRAAQCAGSAQQIRDLSYQIASFFVSSAEYVLRGRTNNQYVEDLYDGIMRRSAAPSEVNFWVGGLDSATMTRDQALQFFTNSPEFQLRVQEVIDAGCLP